MFQSRLNYRLINFLAIVALVYLLITSAGLWWGILAGIISLLAPFIVGFSFAYAFTPLVRWLQKNGFGKTFSILSIIFGIIIFLGLILWITLPLLYDQLSLLAKMIVELTNNLSSKFDMNLGTYEITITDYLNDIIKEIGTFASSTGIDVVNKSFGFIGKFIVGFVAFIYFLIDMDKIRTSVKEWLKSISTRAFEYIRLMDEEITNYLKGLEIFMLIQFFEYSLLFLIVGHPNWLILGILACITTVIPYFGGLITNIIAIILASVVSTKLMICTILICLIFPQLDGYLISPKVYGRTNNVNPLVTIMVVTIGGSLLGVPGIIIALPIYLLVRTTYHFFKPDIQKGMGIVKKNI